MTNFKKNSASFNTPLAKSEAAIVVLCAALAGEAMATSSCGKAGLWVGEGPNQEVAFAKRLGAALPTYFIVPTQGWTSRLGDRNVGPVGGGVCAGDALKLRSGMVTSDFILARTAATRIEAGAIGEDCAIKERELEKLPPDKQALVDEKKQQTRQLLGNKGALAGFTPEEQKARQETIAFENRTKDEHRTAIQPQLQALFRDCNARREPLAKDVLYTLGIAVNPAGSPRNNNETKPIADLGDKSIRSGPNDRVRRVMVYATGNFAAAQSAEDLAALKSFVDLARLQALIDSGGNLPGDAEIASAKATQQADRQFFEKWSSEQNRLVSQAERDRRSDRQGQDTAARRAANPSASPAPAPAQSRAPAAGSEQTNAPAPQAPAVPNLPNVQLPGNVGNVLRGVFGR